VQKIAESIESAASILPIAFRFARCTRLISSPMPGCNLFAIRFRRFNMRVIRLLTLSSLVLAAAISCRIVQHVMADEVAKLDLTPAKPDQPISFHDRLITGLQARLKSEVSFVDAVVKEVQLGHIPQEQVDQTFFWARQRAAWARDGRPHRPIIYFQPAMRARANLLHVTLPPTTP
jgi:hypothetical protein